MSEHVPENLRYTDDHEWARVEDGNVVVVGVTHYAQDALGDITYLELPDVGAAFTVGDAFGVVESVKTFSDLYAPVSGEVIETNEEAIEEPSVINEAPYAGGWLVKIRVDNLDAFEQLLDAPAYAKVLEEQG